jgi:hypothetical protein
LAQSYCALLCARAEIRNRHAQIPTRNPRTPPQSRGKIKTGKPAAHTDRKIQVGCGVTPEAPPLLTDFGTLRLSVVHLRGGSKCQVFFEKCPKTVVRDPFDSGGVRGAPPMLRHHSSIFVHFGCPSSIPFLRLQRWGKQRRACFQNGKFCCLTCFKVLRAQL